MQIIILGCGRVGSAIAYDLSSQYSVTVVDISNQNLSEIKSKCNVNTIEQDLLDTNSLNKLIRDYDLVISAVPGFMGFKTLQNIIEQKKNVVDISFFPEDPYELDEMAKNNQVTALVDFGVAPGLSNIIFGHYDQEINIQEYKCYVGGLPKIKKLPFEYKAPFSPIDVIEEYTRPARIFKNSKIIVKPPLTDLEIISFEETEDLEAFNTDGLRSLLNTMRHVPNMVEKTLRYPGHIKKIKLLKDMGFFSTQTLKKHNKKPIDFTASILENQWLLDPKEEEFTIMKIIIKNQRKNIELVMYDEYDKTTNISSMARTTGFTCTAGANIIINRLFNNYGIVAPEIVGKNINCYLYIKDYLQKRNINVKTMIK